MLREFGRVGFREFMEEILQVGVWCCGIRVRINHRSLSQSFSLTLIG